MHSTKSATHYAAAIPQENPGPTEPANTAQDPQHDHLMAPIIYDPNRPTSSLQKKQNSAVSSIVVGLTITGAAIAFKGLYDLIFDDSDDDE